jgi:hypothetical protein
VDLSGLIFVALAVAWAAYLIPKALKHHEDVARTRSVDKFSPTMRVLARREPVDRRNARLVVTPGKPAPQLEVAVQGEPAVVTPEVLRARRAATNRAARRRRRVLLTLLLANIAVVATATPHDPDSVVGHGCDDQFEFEFALDLMLDGLDRLLAAA